MLFIPWIGKVVKHLFKCLCFSTFCSACLPPGTAPKIPVSGWWHGVHKACSQYSQSINVNGKVPLSESFSSLCSDPHLKPTFYSHWSKCTNSQHNHPSRIPELHKKRHPPKKINYSLKQIAAYEYFITDLNFPAMDKGRELSGIKCCGVVEIGGMVLS